MTHSSESAGVSSATRATHDEPSELTVEDIVNVLTNAHVRIAKPDLCGLCVQDWAAAPSLMCSTCVAVDDVLAAAAGSTHFLPHIWVSRLDEQPRDVMACALHTLHWPNDTGFYGVYTTMNNILRRKARARREAVRQHFANARTSVADIVASLQPSRVQSLAILTDVASESFPELRSWLDGVITLVRVLCEQQDSESPVTLSDYQRARIATVLR
ncbi:MAG: hypothetical protein EBU85_00730 [Actinobacteria bacterium]|nr:hypothetical protein [Actinomycetota bacterium]